MREELEGTETLEEAWKLVDDNFGRPRIQIKALKQRLVALKVNHKQANESMITLAAAVKKAKRITRSIGM